MQRVAASGQTYFILEKMASRWKWEAVTDFRRQLTRATRRHYKPATCSANNKHGDVKKRQRREIRSSDFKGFQCLRWLQPSNDGVSKACSRKHMLFKTKGNIKIRDEYYIYLINNNLKNNNNINYTTQTEIQMLHGH